MSIHKPVLLKECIELLKLKTGMTVVDATLGGGGHSLEINKKIQPHGKLIAIDQDADAINKFRLSSNLEKENAYLINDNFACLGKILNSLKINKVDAVVADLGMSSDQLESAERGFSFMKNGPLDMRLDRRQKLTAFEVVNAYPEKELSRIIREFGEEKYARQISANIAAARIAKPVRTTLDLVELISAAVPQRYKREKLHFATRTFQALRMEVNQEIENLEKFLSQAIETLIPGARIAVISFHSGEDRIVKNFFRENARGCVSTPEEIIYGRRGKPILKIITKKPITPCEQEIIDNPRARSAKLRVAEKI